MASTCRFALRLSLTPDKWRLAAVWASLGPAAAPKIRAGTAAESRPMRETDPRRLSQQGGLTGDCDASCFVLRMSLMRVNKSEALRG